MLQGKCLIGGSWLEGKGSEFVSINPATEEVIGVVRSASEEDVSKACKAAREALRSWQRTDISERANILSKFSLLLRDRAEELAKLISAEMGKPITESNAEITATAIAVDYFATEAERLLEPETFELDFPQPANYTAYVSFEPLGVAALIQPWNFPLMLPLWAMAPALLAGNAVLFKPSELTPFVGMEIGKVFTEAGLPDGVLNILQGEAQTGQYVADSDVDVIAFTGSTKVGRAIASRAGASLKKVILELGGVDPMVICADANLEEAANAAVWGRFSNAGQSCVASKRILVESAVEEEFTERFVQKTSALKVGDPLDPDVEIGPLASLKQLTMVESYVSRTIVEGARLLYGGGRPEGLRKGYYYTPTIFAGVDPNASICREEVFGPVASITAFKDIKEAISYANDSAYGLGASVWTTDEKKALDIAKHIRSGIVWVNDVQVPFPQLPWGGVKSSGFGRMLSRYGLLEFVNIKQTTVNKIREPRRLWWFPY